MADKRRLRKGAQSSDEQPRDPTETVVFVRKFVRKYSLQAFARV